MYHTTLVYSLVIVCVTMSRAKGGLVRKSVGETTFIINTHRREGITYHQGLLLKLPFSASYCLLLVLCGAKYKY